MNEWMNQSINQSINQSTISQSVSQSASQSISPYLADVLNAFSTSCMFFSSVCFSCTTNFILSVNLWMSCACFNQSNCQSPSSPVKLQAKYYCCCLIPLMSPKSQRFCYITLHTKTDCMLSYKVYNDNLIQ